MVLPFHLINLQWSQVDNPPPQQTSFATGEGVNVTSLRQSFEESFCLVECIGIGPIFRYNNKLGFLDRSLLNDAARLSGIAHCVVVGMKVRWL